jgi:hypothetical protein
MRSFALLGFAGLYFAIALALAWVLGVTLFYPNGFLASHIVVRADIVRAHIDYLMMSQFLFIFFLLLRQYSVEPPIWAVAASCFGAFANPLGFLARGLTPKPDPALAIEPHFPVPAIVTFSATTIGFLALVVITVVAAWKARPKSAPVALGGE